MRQPSLAIQYRSAPSRHSDIRAADLTRRVLKRFTEADK